MPAFFGAVVGFVGGVALFPVGRCALFASSVGVVAGGGGTVKDRSAVSFLARASNLRCFAASCCMASAVLWRATTSDSKTMAELMCKCALILAFNSSTRALATPRRFFSHVSSVARFFVAGMDGRSNAVVAFALASFDVCFLTWARRSAAFDAQRLEKHSALSTFGLSLVSAACGCPAIAISKGAVAPRPPAE